ncbi:MAG: hypothetical protein HUJ26_06195 [Planctomycetaceae bacterium]|nr:hypothetical protein [Planctomycetaceae bacterium]
MTLPSHKKHPIIHLSKQVWKTSLSGLGLAGVLVFSTGLHAQEPGVSTLQLRKPATIRLVSQQDAPQGSPLDRLKQRSAQDRFEQLQNEPVPAPLPVDDSEEIEPIARPTVPQKVEAAPNRLPQLPELNELEELDPFEPPTARKLQPIPQSTVKQPKLTPPPAPAPRNLSVVRQQVDPRQKDEAPLEVVRSLSDIRPFYDFESPREQTLNLNPEAENTPEKRYPTDLEFGDDALKPRLSPDRLFAWEASNLFHNPLYFQDPQLERYGHTHGDVIFQPLLSMGRMGVQLVGLPYQTVIDSPHSKQYTLGWYRPGEEAPHLFYQIPLNVEAAAAQGLATTGAAFIVP